jgi:hypothetical protein
MLGARGKKRGQIRRHQKHGPERWGQRGLSEQTPINEPGGGRGESVDVGVAGSQAASHTQRKGR